MFGNLTPDQQQWVMALIGAALGWAANHFGLKLPAKPAAPVLPTLPEGSHPVLDRLKRFLDRFDGGTPQAFVESMPLPAAVASPALPVVVDLGSHILRTANGEVVVTPKSV